MRKASPRKKGRDFLGSRIAEIRTLHVWDGLVSVSSCGWALLDSMSLRQFWSTTPRRQQQA
eukprot:1308458-Pyramimonas_sp.AAC.1